MYYYIKVIRELFKNTDQTEMDRIKQAENVEDID